MEIENLSKKELINLIQTLIEEKVLTAEDVDSRLTNKEMSLDEFIIIEKLNNSEELNNAEKQTIKDRYEKCGNRQISYLQCGKDKFIKGIVEYNINTYFNEIWKIYPRKIGKEVGKKAFSKLVGTCKLKDLKAYAMNIYKRVQWYANNCEETEREEQYILHFSTFCNSKKYL